MKTNSRYNGLTIDMINKHAKSPLTFVTTVNGRDYYEGEKRPGYYRPVLIARDGVVKQGYWFTVDEDVQEFVDRIAQRKADRQNRRREIMASDSGVKVGDIFMAHWGYDETHIDYGVVRSINGRRAVIEDLTGMPGFDGVGSKLTKLIQGTSESPYISLTSYANAYKTTLEKAKADRVQNDVFYTGHYR